METKSTLSKGIKHIHLDLLGGISGDMFIACLLDVFPDYLGEMQIAFKTLFEKIGITIELTYFKDEHSITGSKFSVKYFPLKEKNSHTHRHHNQIIDIIKKFIDDKNIKTIANAIFQIIAEAESKVHGIDAATVEFHEIGAWDSIADILCASFLINKFKNVTWSFSDIPIGNGRINSMHGIITIPAPATVEILHGMNTFDDEIKGERVTPTGAAILHFLFRSSATRNYPKKILYQGRGFGTKQFPQLSNHLRCLLYTNAVKSSDNLQAINIIEFDVDDQTSEDIAVSIDRLNNFNKIIEATQCPIFGKKGRIATRIQVICEEKHTNFSIEQCFLLTTTIGVRFYKAYRKRLDRKTYKANLCGKDINVKAVIRPGGLITCKAESDDSLFCTTHFDRATLRTNAEKVINNKLENDEF